MSKASGTIGQGGATLVHLKSNRFQIKRAGKLTLTMHELVFESDGIFAKNFSIMLRNVQSCKQTETSSGHPAIEVIFLASSGTADEAIFAVKAADEWTQKILESIQHSLHLATPYHLPQNITRVPAGTVNSHDKPRRPTVESGYAPHADKFVLTELP
jgi:hypothetical protein